jgi:hypothetical protein
MKRIKDFHTTQLYESLWISYVVLKNDDDALTHMESGNKTLPEFDYVFGKTEEEAKNELSKKLHASKRISETDFEAFF